MFHSEKSFNQEISEWDVSSGQDFVSMQYKIYYFAKSIYTDYRFIPIITLFMSNMCSELHVYYLSSWPPIAIIAKNFCPALTSCNVSASKLPLKSLSTSILVHTVPLFFICICIGVSCFWRKCFRSTLQSIATDELALETRGDYKTVS